MKLRIFSSVLELAHNEKCKVFEKCQSPISLKRFKHNTKLIFVPSHEPVKKHEVNCLQSFVNSQSKILVITGAGVSTESGIPDYRSEGVGLYARSNHRPMRIQEFLASPVSQQRYWARNYMGWPRFYALEPNTAHITVKEWEDKGIISAIVTQNVDGLHEKANSKFVIPLHGTGHVVKCLSCSFSTARQLFQNTLSDLNSSLTPNIIDSMIRPDGDIDLPQEVVEKFHVPPCPSCNGVLKPDIVFFGDNVPKDRVDLIYEQLAISDSLLILGSSLQTFSAFRYVIAAKERDLPIGIINLGPCRADSVASFKLTCRVGEILPLISV